MTACVLIPMWIICWIGECAGVFGMWVAIDEYDKYYWWQPILGGVSVDLLLISGVALLWVYIAPLVIPLLPCITVIP
jgi:hypothetical protein